MVPVMMKGSSVSVATIALGSTWRNMIVPFATPKRAGGADIFEVPRPQEFGPHHADQRGPAEQHHQHRQQPEVHLPDRGDDDDDVEAGRSSTQSSMIRWKIRSVSPPK